MIAFMGLFLVAALDGYVRMNIDGVVDGDNLDDREDQSRDERFPRPRALLQADRRRTGGRFRGRTPDRGAGPGARRAGDGVAAGR
jgi:hypothetical protein